MKAIQKITGIFGPGGRLSRRRALVQINHRPPLKTIAVNAHITGLLPAGAESAQCFLMNNYIQVGVYSDYHSNLNNIIAFSPKVSYSSLEGIGILDVVNPHLDGAYDEIESGSRSVIEYLVKMLDKGYCIMVALNQFHLPYGPWSGNCHHMHRELVCGYDDSKRRFDVMSFGGDSNGIVSYECRGVPYKVFSDAYANVSLALQSKRYRNNDWINWSASSPRMISFRYNQDSRLTISREQIFGSINDYLCSTLSKSNYEKSGLRLIPGMSIFGLNTYDVLINLLEERIRDPRLPFFDSKTFYFVWEHKNLMSARLKYLEDMGYLEEQRQLSGEYLQVEKLAREVRFIMLEYQVKRESSALRYVCKCLNEMRELEDRILSCCF